ncbi:MAG: hypothetical protein HY397_03360 [Candidatus Doudnabacteria bacterium]|nr:hypothetical protein [Candidatus Doudnabacteria bacterium]
MYYYLVDPASFDGKNFEFFQTQLLGLLGEYQITGEIARVTKLRRVEDLILTALAREVSTLIVVGSDQTFHQAVEFTYGKPVVLGFIPITAQSEVGEILGVNGLQEAVSTIAKRMVVALDLIKAERKYFLSSLNFSVTQKSGLAQNSQDSKILPNFLASLAGVRGVEMRFVFDGRFVAKDKFIFGSIVNTRALPSQAQPVKLGDPRDGRLDVILVSQLSRLGFWRYKKIISAGGLEAVPGCTVVHAKTVEIKFPAGVRLYVSKAPVAETPTVLGVAKEKIRVIAGKNRKF